MALSEDVRADREEKKTENWRKRNKLWRILEEREGGREERGRQATITTVCRGQ